MYLLPKECFDIVMADMLLLAVKPTFLSIHFQFSKHKLSLVYDSTLEIAV